MGYAQYGDKDGIPVLAIHGTPGSRKMMKLAHDFAHKTGIRLIAPDRPGYGLSSRGNHQSLSQWATDVKVLLNSLAIERFYLFGVSGGGPFAMAIATLLPKNVRAVALASPVGLIDDQVRKKWSWRNAAYFEYLPRAVFLMKLLFPILRFAIRYTPNLTLRLFILSLGKSDRLILGNSLHAQQLLSAFDEGFSQGVGGAVDDLVLFSNPWQIPLPEALMPVIIWQGLDDLMVPAAATWQLAASLSDAEIIVLPGEGHFWIFDHYEEVINRLLGR